MSRSIDLGQAVRAFGDRRGKGGTSRSYEVFVSEPDGEFYYFSDDEMRAFALAILVDVGAPVGIAAPAKAVPRG